MSHTSLFRRVANPCGLTAVMALCLALGGCGSSMKTSPTVLNAKANRQQSSESTFVTEGQTLTVRLPTEGGTMYFWRMTNDSFRNDMIELQRRQDQQTAEGQIAGRGEPACDVFTFRAKRTGHVTMMFGYEHKYSVNDPIKKYSLDVDVVNPGVATASANAQ